MLRENWGIIPHVLYRPDLYIRPYASEEQLQRLNGYLKDTGALYKNDLLRVPGSLSLQQRKELIKLLDSLHYFDFEKPVFSKDRLSLMKTFTNRGMMDDACATINLLKDYHGPIGLAMIKEYPLFFYARSQTNFSTINIACHKESRHTPLNSLVAGYQCIITNLPVIIQKIDPQFVDHIANVNHHIFVIYLRRPLKAEFILE